MSMAATLPFNPDERVMRGCDGPFATVLACEARAEAPNGIYMVVRYDATGEQVAVLASEFSPIPERSQLIRSIPLPAGVAHPAPAGTLPALSGAPPCSAQGAASGAPLSSTEAGMLEQIVSTIRRHTENDYAD